MPYDQSYGMSPQQMIQFGLGLTQPRPANTQPLPFVGGQGGGMQAAPYSGGGSGNMQTLPDQPDPLDSYSDDAIARAFYKRQGRARIGNKTY